MSVELIWAELCTNAIVDERTHAVSLINIIENIEAHVDFRSSKDGEEKAKQALGIPITFCMVSKWRSSLSDGKAEEVEVGYSIVGPSGKEVDPIKPTRISVAPNRGARVIMNYNGFPAKEGSGQYFFHVKSRNVAEGSRWKTITKVPLTLKLLTNIVEPAS